MQPGTPERIHQDLDTTRASTEIKLFYNTLTSTYSWYRKAKLPLRGELIVRLRIRISPEIRVIIGAPAGVEE